MKNIRAKNKKNIIKNSKKIENRSHPIDKFFTKKFEENGSLIQHIHHEKWRFTFETLKSHSNIFFFNFFSTSTEKGNSFIHTFPRTKWKNLTFWPLDETSCNFWHNGSRNSIWMITTICDFGWDHQFHSLYLRTLWSRAWRETDYNTLPIYFTFMDKIKM